MKRHIEVYRDIDMDWRFRLRGDNGEIIAQSEGYNNSADVHKTILEYFTGWHVERVYEDESSG